MAPKDKATKRICYIGDDNSYWSSIVDRIGSIYNEYAIEFKIFHNPNKLGYRWELSEILKFVPDIIYLDMTFNSDGHLLLSRMIKQDQIIKKGPLVGLVDGKELSPMCFTSGCDFVHIKCGEFHDVIYDPFALAFPKIANTEKFATANFKTEAVLTDIFRVNYFTPEIIHLEGNLFIETGEEITINIDLPKKIIKSPNFVVRSRSSSDLYYCGTYSYDFGIKFVDVPDVSNYEPDLDGVDDDGAINAMIDKAKKEFEYAKATYQEDLELAKNKHLKWVEDKGYDNLPKVTKVLIIDQYAEIMTDPEFKDPKEYKFAFRHTTTLNEDASLIDRIRPKIIAYQFPGEKALKGTRYESTDEQRGSTEEANPLSPEEMTQRDKILRGHEKEALGEMAAIIKMITRIDGYKPFIVLFNCKNFSSKSFQDSYQYPLVVVNTDPIKFKILLQMAEMMEMKQDKIEKTKVEEKLNILRKKDPKKYGRLKASDLQETRFYVKKKAKEAYASYSVPIMIKKMSESEVYIKVGFEIPNINFEIDYPVKFYARVLPNSDGKEFEKEDTGYVYRALIHNVHEDDKKAIRQAVNQIFFATLNEKRKKEMEEFKAKKTEVEKGREPKEGEEENDSDSDNDNESTG